MLVYLSSGVVEINFQEFFETKVLARLYLLFLIRITGVHVIMMGVNVCFLYKFIRLGLSCNFSLLASLKKRPVTAIVQVESSTVCSRHRFSLLLASTFDIQFEILS